MLSEEIIYLGKALLQLLEYLQNSCYMRMHNSVRNVETSRMNLFFPTREPYLLVFFCGYASVKSCPRELFSKEARQNQNIFYFSVRILWVVESSSQNV